MVCSAARLGSDVPYSKSPACFPIVIELRRDSSRPGLPLGTDAPVMTPNGVDFLFFSFAETAADCLSAMQCGCCHIWTGVKAG